MGPDDPLAWAAGDDDAELASALLLRPSARGGAQPQAAAPPAAAAPSPRAPAGPGEAELRCANPNHGAGCRRRAPGRACDRPAQRSGAAR